MHELSLALEVIDLVEKETGRREISGIREILIEVGTLSGVEADAFHCVEGSKWDSVNGKLSSLYRSLRPWYVLRWNLRKLGRSMSFRLRYDGTSSKRQGLSDEDMEVGLANSTLSMGKPCTWGSGQQEGDRFKLYSFDRHTEVNL